MHPVIHHSYFNKYNNLTSINQFKSGDKGFASVQLNVTFKIYYGPESIYGALFPRQLPQSVIEYPSMH